MFDEMVLYHYILVQILLGVLVIGIVIPFLSSDSNKIIKRMRIYIFVFHGFITTVAFSGLVAFVFGKMSFDLSIVAMIVVYIFISVLESIKYIKILKYNDKSKIVTTNIKFTLLSVSLIVALIIWKILEHSSAVSLS